MPTTTTKDPFGGGPENWSLADDPFMLSDDLELSEPDPLMIDDAEYQEWLSRVDSRAAMRNE